MLPSGEPKWRRRKSQRPAEIIAAALEVFSEKGFAAAKLDEIARLAGVSKGALYLYFETKEDLFRAVVQEAVAPNVSQVQSLASVEAPFGEVLRTVFGAIARLIAGDRRISSVAKVVICESRNFPELGPHLARDRRIARRRPAERPDRARSGPRRGARGRSPLLRLRPHGARAAEHRLARDLRADRRRRHRRGGPGRPAPRHRHQGAGAMKRVASSRP
jgi:AcrR family transcriptional regulator